MEWLGGIPLGFFTGLRVFTVAPRAQKASVLLHLQLEPQALLVPEDRRERKCLAATDESHGDVTVIRLAIHLDGIPLLGVADIVDAHVVVRAPEEGHLDERFTGAEHVAGGTLAHALRYHPVLH